MDWLPGMRYVIYGLFAIWMLNALGGLFLGVFSLAKLADAPSFKLRPTWYYFASSFYVLAVAGLLMWLYFSGVLDESWILLAGFVVFLPEVAYFFWSRTRGR